MLKLRYAYNTQTVFLAQSRGDSLHGLQVGMTGLMLATQRGDVEIVRTLLDSHANPNISEMVTTNCMCHNIVMWTFLLWL